MIERILQFVVGLLEAWKNRESAKTFGSVRSPQWLPFRNKFVKLHPRCELCGGTKKLQVHHKRPFHLHSELELDPNNLITLCESGANGIQCHRGFGHLGDFKSFNVDIVEDAKIWHDKIKNRPYEES